MKPCIIMVGVSQYYFLLGIKEYGVKRKEKNEPFQMFVLYGSCYKRGCVKISINYYFSHLKSNTVIMYTFKYLHNFTRDVFIKMGCNAGEAEKIADVFLAAELRGLPSHGMIRIKDYYQLWKAGRINVSPDIKIVYETPSTAVVDGDGGVGMVAATRSMEIAIEKALKVGTGWVSTRNSNHYGIKA
jgi:Malate/L-lactate dehydrogenase